MHSASAEAQTTSGHGRDSAMRSPDRWARPQRCASTQPLHGPRAWPLGSGGAGTAPTGTTLVALVPVRLPVARRPLASTARARALAARPWCPIEVGSASMLPRCARGRGPAAPGGGVVAQAQRGPSAMATARSSARVLAESSEVRGTLAAPSATIAAALASMASFLLSLASAAASSATARGTAARASPPPMRTGAHPPARAGEVPWRRGCAAALASHGGVQPRPVGVQEWP